MSTTKMYNYCRLATGELRFLRLLPGQKDDELVGKLETGYYEDGRPYEPLSYAWGTKPAALPMQIADAYGGEGTLLITETLASALRHLRYEAEERLLWVDQLCIDQANAVEKGTQVANVMRVVYALRKVIVWLGDESEDSAAAIDKIHHAYAGFVVQRIPVDSKTAELGSIAMRDAAGQFEHADWLAVVRFFERPWFRRLWVVQEVCANPSHPIVLCGKHEVAWYALASIQDLVVRHNWAIYGSEGLALGLRVSENLTDSLLFYQRLETKQNMAVDLMCALSSRLCGLPADRIFGLREMWWPDEQKDSPVNYEQPVHELYTAFTRAHIQRTHKLTVLGLCVAQKNFALPSWVPDWTLSASDRPLILMPVPSWRESIEFDALPGQPNAILNESSNPQVLSLQGYAVRFISTVSDDRPFKGRPKDTAALREFMSTFWGCYFIFRALGSPQPMPFSNLVMARSEMASAAYRALILDKTNGSTPMTDQSTSEDALLDYFKDVSRVMPGRKLFLTADGDVGVGPYEICAGDRVCLFPGAAVPLILRETEVKGRWELIGECYCHTLMKGAGPGEGAQLESFEIV